MRHGPLTLMTALATMLVACTPPAEEEPPAVAVQPSPTQAAASTAPIVGYACESGQTVNVQYVDDATARVTYNGATADLRLTPSGSGARYAGEQWEWWSATREGQEQATLGRMGPNAEVGVTVLERCTRPTSGGGVPGPQPAPGPGPGPGTAPVAGSPCRGPQLRLAAEAGDAGAGSRETVYALTNVGTQACTVQGHVGVTLQDAQGRALTAVRVDRIDASGGTTQTSAPVVPLAPQAKAWFGIRWSVVSDQTQGQRTCPTVTRLRVTAPGDTSPTSLDQTFTPCGGKVSVTPLRPTREPGAASAPRP